MQRNVILALTAALVTTALVGVAAIPATAGQTGDGETDGLFGARDVGADSDADDGGAEASARSQHDDDSVAADAAVDGDDETASATARTRQNDESGMNANDEDTVELSENSDNGTEIGSLVKVGSVEKDDERGEDQLTQLSDDQDHGEGSDEEELIKIGDGEDDISAEAPPDRDDNTIELGPFGI